MIGIGNDLFDNFKDLVNAEVECLDPKEIMTRLKVVVCLETVEERAQTRIDWDASRNGAELRRLKSKAYRQKKALTTLGVLKNPNDASAETHRDRIPD